MPGRRRGRSSARAAFSRNRRREQGRGRHLADDDVLDLLGVREEQLLDAVDDVVAVGQPDRDPVVRPDRPDLAAEPLAETGLERERPRGVDPATERRQQHQPPVAELVAEALDDDPPVGRQGAGDLALVLEVGDEVLGGELVEVVVLAQPADAPRSGPRGPRARSASASPTNAPSARPSSIGRPTASPCQNGSLPGTPGAGETVTRSWAISSIRQLLAPSVITSPARLS